jgi:hypothetical protein
MNASTYAGIRGHSISMQEYVTLRNRMTARGTNYFCEDHPKIFTKVYLILLLLKEKKKF